MDSIPRQDEQQVTKPARFAHTHIKIAPIYLGGEWYYHIRAMTDAPPNRLDTKRPA